MPSHEAMRPEKRWAAGDKAFLTYKEARTYLAARRGQVRRERLTEIVLDALIDQLALDSDKLAEIVVDAVLDKFRIIPRK
jgi:hypothetical protein